MIETTDGNGESKIRKVLFNEISFLVAGIGLISSVMFWVMNPQQQLQLDIVRLQSEVESNETVAAELSKIKNNDLHEITVKLLQLEERQIKIMEAIARLEVLALKK
jgi:hypothetical protein